MPNNIGALTELMRRMVHSVPEKYTRPEVQNAIRLQDHHRVARNRIIDGKDVGHYATLMDFYNNTDPAASSHSMIAQALGDAAVAPKYWNEDYRLLALPGPTDDLLRAAAGYYAPGHFVGSPAEKAVYIQNIGSLERGAGAAMLKDIVERYPESPVVLESLPIDATRQFYVKHGFVPQGNREIVPGSEHENFWLNPGRFKKRGGLVALEKRQ